MAPSEAGNAKQFGVLTLPFYSGNLSLARTFLLDTSSTEFKTSNAGTGGTIDVVSSFIKGGTVARKHTAANRAAGDAFVYENIEEVSTPITLSDYYYYGISTNYNEETFISDTLATDSVPQAGAKVAQSVNDDTMAIVNGVISADVSAAVELAGSDEVKAAQIIKKIIALRQELNARRVPTTGRTLAVGTAVAATLLVSPQLLSVSASGSEDALVNATLGFKWGFTIVEEPGLDEFAMIAYQSGAFALVLRTKAPSLNAIDSTVVSEDGYVLNVTIDRDGYRQTDLVLVGTFAGVAQLDPNKAVVAKFSDSVAG